MFYLFPAFLGYDVLGFLSHSASRINRRLVSFTLSSHSHTKFQATSSFKFWHTSRTYACNFIFWPETLLSFLSSKHRFNWITICIWWRDEKIGGIFFCCLLFCCCCLVGIAECHCIMSLRNLVGRIRRVIKESHKLYNYFIVEDCASCYVWLRF